MCEGSAYVLFVYSEGIGRLVVIKVQIIRSKKGSCS